MGNEDINTLVGTCTVHAYTYLDKQNRLRILDLESVGK